MNKLQVCFVLGIVCLIKLTACTRHTKAQESAADGEVHALLVGVTYYSKLGEKDHLEGPIHDVRRMVETLSRRFKTPVGNIVELTEARPKGFKPTYDNIKREFLALADPGRVKAGDQVVILLSGHGSQIPNDDPDAANDDEVDGLDEVFVPRDVGVFNKKTNRLEGKIVRDDEIKIWLDRIQDRGATVLFLSDSCHSESQSRSGEPNVESPKFKTRKVELIPDKFLHPELGTKSSGDVRFASVKKTPFFNKPLRGSLVSFYAARSKQETPDGFYHPETGDWIEMGLLSYAVCEALDNNSVPITYRELGQQIDHFFAICRAKSTTPNVPNPVMEAVDVDRVVLGSKMLPGRSMLTFAKKREKLLINGGSLNGVTKGTILKLYPVAGSAESKSIGWAVIESVQATESIAKAINYSPGSGDVSDAVEGFKTPRGRCVVHARNIGKLKLRVALDSSLNSAGDLSDQIKSLANQETSPLQLVSVDDAEFVFSVAEGKILLSRFDARLQETATFDLGSPQTPDGRPFNSPISRIQGAFERILKAKNLLDVSMKQKPCNHPSNKHESAISVQVVFEVSDQEGDGGNWQEWDLANEDRLPVGKYARCTVKNHSQSPVKVTMLYVGDDYRITPVIPREKFTNNEIQAAKDGVPGQLAPFKLGEIRMDSRMPEAIVTIATRSNQQAAKSDYTSFRQTPLAALWTGAEPKKEVRLSSTRDRLSADESMASFERAINDTGFNSSRTRLVAEPDESDPAIDYSISVSRWVATSPTNWVAKPENSVPLDLSPTYGPKYDGPWLARVARRSSRGIGESVYPKVAPGVVVVRTGSGHGTGFLISEDGWMLTNHHVVEDAAINEETGIRSVDVNIGQLKDGWMSLIDEPIKADIYKWSEQKDLALLKLKTIPSDKKLTPIELAEKVPGPGSDCIAIGHPGKGALWTLRSGSIAGVAEWPGDCSEAVMERLDISASERKKYKEKIRSATQKTVLLSECGLNPGDSGGPLLDKDGKLVAVSFAIPSFDAESGVSYDKFSYHVHLKEVKAFIADRPSEPLKVELQASKKDKFKRNGSKRTNAKSLEFDGDWKISKVKDFTANKTNETVLLAGGDESGIGLLIDLDEDSDEKDYQNAESLSEIIDSRDSEFGLIITGDESRFFYDTDNDGEFDLVLIDRDGDGRGDVTSLPVISLSHFNSDVGRKFERSFKALLFTLRKYLHQNE